MPQQCHIRALLAMCCLVILTACEWRPEPLLRVGCIVWPGYEPLFLARSLGAYRDHPIQLVEFSSQSEVIRSFENGAIEAAALTGDEMLRVAQGNPAVRAILVMDISNGGDGLVVRRDISSLKGLAGKRVGVEANGVGSYLLSRALEIAGLSITNVHVVNVPVSSQEEAYARGEVDAVVTFEPILSKLREKGAAVLFDSSKIPGEILDFLLVRQETLSTHQKTLRALLQGWFEARDNIMAQPVQAASSLAARERLRTESFLQALRGLKFPDAAENIRFLGRTNSPAGLDALAATLYKRGLLTKPLNGAALLDAQLASTAAR